LRRRAWIVCGKWRRDEVANQLMGRRRSGRLWMPRSAANQGHDPVELPAHGRSPGSQQVHHQQYLAESQFETASSQNLQAVAGCEVSREIDRRRGPVCDPPQQAMVLCVDEKSQVQALDRTQPGLPLKKGRCGTMTMTISGTERLLCLPLWKFCKDG